MVHTKRFLQNKHSEVLYLEIERILQMDLNQRLQNRNLWSNLDLDVENLSYMLSCYSLFSIQFHMRNCPKEHFNSPQHVKNFPKRFDTEQQIWYSDILELCGLGIGEINLETKL